MSTPENTLARYRTYSYHHVLVACENTDVGEALATNPNTYKYLQTSGKTRFAKNSISVDGVGIVGDYIIIANSLIDSDFVVDDVSWMSVLFPQPTKANFEQFAAFTTEGTFNVMEPRGVEFLNILSQAATCFGTDTTNMVFMLKTFFVGDADTERVDYITNIKGMMFAMTDITANFDTTGSLYNVQFVGITNGVAKLPQNVTGPQVNINTNKTGGTVGDVLAQLQSNIQDNYGIHYEALTKSNDGVEPGQRVEYIINIDKESGYADYKIDQIPNQRSEVGTDDGKGIISFGKNSSIESMILDVMRSCKRCGDDSNGQGKDARVYTPKILSTIKSGKKGNNNYHQVIYTLTKLTIPMSTIENIQNIDQTFVEAGNALELDYFFSGKNTDILEFNLQMQMGLAFFQTITTAKTTPNNEADDVKTSELVGASDGTKAPSKDAPEFPDCKPDTKRITPILFSTDFSEAKQKNNRYPVASIDFQSLLQRQAAIEMLEAKIKIVGNPILLDNIILTPSEAAAGRPDPAKNPGDVMKNWTTIPGLVRVNIFSPAGEVGEEYDKKFWYDGWYYIISVENSFSQGLFTQTLEMQSLPLDVYLPGADAELPKVHGMGR